MRGIARGIDGVGAGDGLEAATAGCAFSGAGVGVFAGRAVFFFFFGLGVGVFFALDLRLVDFFATDFFLVDLGRGVGEFFASEAAARVLADAAGSDFPSSLTWARRTAPKIAPSARAVANQSRRRTT